MKYNILLVPFPFDDLSETKVRPAIALTDSISGYKHIVIAFITSQITKANEASDLAIVDSDKNFAMTGLKVSSAIRLHRLVTIPTRIVQRKLGKLPVDYHSDLEQKLKDLFGL